MIISERQFAPTFAKILKSSLSYSTCKLVIFVSAFNLDSICAVKILIDILKRDYYIYQLIPVLGYMDLKAKYQQLDSEVTNVLLIGCGACADLESFLEIDIKDHLPKSFNMELLNDMIKRGEELPLDRKLYIIDGRRPWNLDNLFGSGIIHCFDDGTADGLKDERTAFDFIIENYKEGDEEEESSSESELEELANDEDDDDDSDSDGDGTNNNKRRNNSPDSVSSKKKKRTLMNQYNDLIEEYYSQGTTLSIPSSLQMYSMITNIGESNLDFLWLVIIGSKSLQDKYESLYDQIYPLLKSEVNRLESVENSRLLREKESDNVYKVDINKKSNGVIIKSVLEYNLFLTNQWTLHNSLYYSNYINSKLHIYTNDGRRLLKTLLAKMGISLEQSRQNFKELPIDLKESLIGIFNEHLPKFDLNNITVPGFHRYYGFNGVLTSDDFVQAVTSLLEYNKTGGFEIKSKKAYEINGQNGAPKQDEEEDEAEKEEESEQERIERITNVRNEAFMKSFWNAYDSLSDYNKIMKGIEYAKIEQQFIFERGSEILLKDMVKSMNKFKMVILNESFTNNANLNELEPNNLGDEETLEIKSIGSRQLFQNPLILTRLGNWILDVYSETDSDVLPLIICALDVESGTYLICGLPPKIKLQNSQQNLLNAFSVIFERVTNEINIQARFDSFESTVIEIKKEDLARFIEALNRNSRYITV